MANMDPCQLDRNSTSVSVDISASARPAKPYQVRDPFSGLLCLVPMLQAAAPGGWRGSGAWRSGKG